MNKLFLVFACMSCLAFAACGQGGGEGGDESGDESGGGGAVKSDPVSPMVGTWALDTAAVVKALEEKLAQEPNPMGEMMIGVVQGMSAEMVLNDDDTFAVEMKMKNPMTGDGETELAKGTWELDGDKLTITTIEANGKVNETPDVKVASYQDGAIIITAGKGSAPFDMVFKKK